MSAIAAAPASATAVAEAEWALERASPNLRSVVEPAPKSPEEALRGLVVAAEDGWLEDGAAKSAMALIAEPDAPMALLFLAYAERARAAGLEMRLVFAQRRRAWGWWRAAGPAAAYDILGPRRLRFLEGSDARRYYNQAVFGLTALWSGARIGRSRYAAWGGSFSAIAPTPEGRERAARAHASFEAVWMVARGV